MPSKVWDEITYPFPNFNFNNNWLYHYIPDDVNHEPEP